MITTFKLKSSELNTEFIEAVKRLFYDKEIEILIRTTSLTENKDFEYSEKLLAAIKNIENQKELVSFTIDEFEAYSKKLAK